MKISFIQVNKLLLLAVCCLAFQMLPAQDLGKILFGQDSKETYMGQLNYNGKRKNGFGIERYRNGSVYVGDFNEDKISGRGMMIALEKGISNVPGAVVYVGAWRDGKKVGRGTAYDSNGAPVFSGTFAGDKPQGSGTDDATSSFVMQETDNTLYWGESTDGQSEGFGLMMQEDGTILFGRFAAGVPSSVGMRFYSPELWEVGVWKDGEFRVFNNAKKAYSDIAAVKFERKQSRKEMWNSLLEAGSNFAQAGLKTMEIVNGVSGKNTASASGGDGDGASVPSGKSLSYYQTEYKKLEQKAKNTYGDRVRHKSTAKTSGDALVASSDAKLLRTYQKSMRKVRLMAQKQGFNIPVSEYEKVSF